MFSSYLSCFSHNVNFSLLRNVISRLLVNKWKCSVLGCRVPPYSFIKFHVFKYCTWQEVMFMYRFTVIQLVLKLNDYFLIFCVLIFSVCFPALKPYQSLFSVYELALYECIFRLMCPVPPLICIFLWMSVLYTSVCFVSVSVQVSHTVMIFLLWFCTGSNWTFLSISLAAFLQLLKYFFPTVCESVNQPLLCVSMKKCLM